MTEQELIKNIRDYLRYEVVDISYALSSTMAKELVELIQQNFYLVQKDK